MSVTYHRPKVLSSYDQDNIPMKAFILLFVRPLTRVGLLKNFIKNFYSFHNVPEIPQDVLVLMHIRNQNLNKTSPTNIIIVKRRQAV